MKKKHLITALTEIGLSVLDQNGLLIISSGSGTFWYLRSRILYSKPWLYLHCYLHPDLFENADWKTAYSFITSKHKQLNIMKESFTHAAVRSYLSAYYSPTFRRNNEDHFYNYRNRKTIGLVFSTVKQKFTEQEVTALFSTNGEFPAHIEILRFKQFVTNNQNK